MEPSGPAKSSSLNVHALEFKPRDLTAITNQPDPGNTSKEPCQGHTNADGVFNVCTTDEAAWEVPGPLPMIFQEDAIEFLSQWFPSYSVGALESVYEGCGYDLALAYDTLWEIEGELAQSSADTSQDTMMAASAFAPMDSGSPGAAGYNPTTHAPDRVQDIVVAPEAFPELGAQGPRGPTPTAQPPSQVSWASIASKQPSSSSTYRSTSSKTATREDDPGSRPLNRSKFSRDIPWVQTGTALSKQYKEARQEARDHARVRNAYFQQATLAFLSGNKALAKELADKGRAYNEQMATAHQVASKKLLSERRAKKEIVSLSGARMPLLDLHGLHVKEAIQVLQNELEQYQLDRYGGSGGGDGSQSMLVLVGTGHHTVGSNTPARLPGAVKSFLVDRGIKYQEVQPGTLKVNF